MARTLERMPEDDGLLEPVEGSGGSMLDQFDLQHYLRTLRKHKWPIVLFTAAVTALAAYYAFTATPIYRATSMLLIEPQQNNIVSIEELVGVDTENQDYYQTQFELLRSPRLARRVIERLELWGHPELARERVAGASAIGTGAEGAVGLLEGVRDRLGLGGDRAPDGPVSEGRSSALAEAGQGAPSGSAGVDAGAGVSNDPGGEAASSVEGGASGDYFESRDVMRDEGKLAAVSNFMSRLTITPIRNTKLVKISFDSKDPVFAARVANTVGEEYITSYLDARMELTTKASEWLNGRLSSLKSTLDASQERLNLFKQENGLVDVDGSVGRLNEQELLLISAELAQARSDLAATASLYREVQALRGRPEALESVPAVQADPLVQNVKIEKGQSRRELDELRNRYGERHPRVVDAMSRLESLDTTLQGHIARVVGTIEQDYQLKQQRVTSIESKFASGKSEIQAIGTKKFGLDALEREVATNQGIYDTFFSRMTEAKSADGLEQANARISDYATPPSGPIKPKKQLIIALAALASLVLSMLMAFLYEQMDDTVKSTEDIEGKLGVRLLGILPLLKEGGLFGRSKDLPLNPLEIVDKNGTFAEATKTVRTALCFGGRSEHKKVILVTSSVPGEGKSTSAINLAYSFGQLERVLLIDCDMRRPTIAKTVGLDKDAPGLSNLILRTSSPRNCIHPRIFDGAVDVLPSGVTPEHPLEVLSSRRFEKLLEQLGEHYDRIIIDCAPTQAVSDALMLSRLCDAVVYVVKSHDTSIDVVKRGLQRLGQVGAEIAGVLITQVNIDKITSYGGDYYYQGYYDYYGYSDEEKREKLKLSTDELLELRNDDSEIEFDLDYDRRFASAVASSRRAPADRHDIGSRAADAENDRVVARVQDGDEDDRLGYGAPTTQRSDERGEATRRRMSDDLDLL